MRALLLLSLALLPLLTGCSSASGQLAAGVDLKKIKRVWVERRLADNNNVRDRFVVALKARGLDADAGPLTMMPEKTFDAVLVYDDRWDWNFRSYMTDLRAELRNPTNQTLMAQAYIQRGPFAGNSPDEMVAKIVSELFRERSGRIK